MFVGEGIGKESPWEKLKGQIFLGRAEFIDKLKGRVKNAEEIKEVPKAQRCVGRPGLRKLIKGEDTKE